MASSIDLKSLLLLCIIWSLNSSSPNASSSTTSTSLDSHLSSIRSICKSTPYPDVCFDSLKLSISINISPTIITSLIQSLQTAMTETGKLSTLFSSVGGTSSQIIEKQRGAIQDCKELQQITMASLEKSMSRVNSAADSRNIADASTFLTAALTNKNTCLEGLDSASGPMKPTLVNSVVTTYEQISNCLSLLPKPASVEGHINRRLLSFPKWLSREDRRILQDTLGSGDGYDPSGLLVVAADGSGNYISITDAINFAPNNSNERVTIHVKAGLYEENIDIPSYKPNIFLLGDGSDVTVITGSRSVGDGWTTFRSATVAVSGERFLARDITFKNTAGPEKHQAVALRINADLAAVYRCTMDGYQDTLYVHSFRQFYRECNIYGTIDFIFGNAAVVLQKCNIVTRMPLPGQYTVITAQSRDSPYENSGISIQRCYVVASDDLSSSAMVKSYLGRPWRVYSRTVYIGSYIDGFIDPVGWMEWPNHQGLDTLYYGEYANSGPGSATENRVTWPGYHVMDYNDASYFAVSQFISGDEWLYSTSIPYDAGI